MLRSWYLKLNCRRRINIGMITNLDLPRWRRMKRRQRRERVVTMVSWVVSIRMDNITDGGPHKRIRLTELLAVSRRLVGLEVC